MSKYALLGLGALALLLFIRRPSTQPPPTCEPGFHWDATVGACVPDQPPPPPPLAITIAAYPWGAVLGDVGSGLDVDMYVENNDIQFDLVDANIQERQYHLIRIFDPTGLHVKDYTNSLSPTDRQDIDVAGAQITNVAGICGICNYQPGVWRAYVLVSLTPFAQDTSKPLKYGQYTCVTEGKVCEDRGQLSIVV